MNFGGQAQTGVAGDARRARLMGLASALLITFFLLISAGCGGGGSESPDGGGGGATNATVNGRVVNASSGQPLAGAAVQYGDGAIVLTAADGTFTLPARSNKTSVVKVTGSGSLSLYDYGTVNSQAYRVRTAGIPIPALTSGQVYPVGSIQVFTSDGAPPPPII